MPSSRRQLAAVKIYDHTGNKRHKLQQRISGYENCFKTKSNKGEVSWGLPLILHYLQDLVRHHIFGITWSNLPAASARPYLPQESGYHAADFQQCWCWIFIKKRTNSLQPPAPSWALPSLLACREQGRRRVQPLSACPGLSSPQCIYLVTSLFHFHVQFPCPSPLWYRKEAGISLELHPGVWKFCFTCIKASSDGCFSCLGVNRVLSSESVEISFMIS